jgi:hypothetical protein
MAAVLFILQGNQQSRENNKKKDTQSRLLRISFRLIPPPRDLPELNQHAHGLLMAQVLQQHLPEVLIVDDGTPTILPVVIDPLVPQLAGTFDNVLAIASKNDAVEALAFPGPHTECKDGGPKFSAAAGVPNTVHLEGIGYGALPGGAGVDDSAAGTGGGGTVVCACAIDEHQHLLRVISADEAEPWNAASVVADREELGGVSAVARRVKAALAVREGSRNRRDFENIEVGLPGTSGRKGLGRELRESHARAGDGRKRERGVCSSPLFYSKTATACANAVAVLV